MQANAGAKNIPNQTKPNQNGDFQVPTQEIEAAYPD